jgi:hypothetical protein
MRGSLKLAVYPILGISALTVRPMSAQTTRDSASVDTGGSAVSAPMPARRFAMNLGATTIAWREAGVSLASELRISRYLSLGIAGSASVLGFSDATGVTDGVSAAWEGRVTLYPQGRSLHGWQAIAGVGRQRLIAEEACTGGNPTCDSDDETRTTVALMGGHQWLLGTTHRWTAGVVAGARGSVGPSWARVWRYNRVQPLLSLRFGFAL